jgi:enoyl-CoA hydratase/carnithine racemase
VRLGIALRTVVHDKLLDEAMALAEKLAGKPHMAVQMAKSFYNRGLGGDDMRYAVDAFPFLFQTDDVKEGVAAFRAKRKPEFK